MMRILRKTVASSVRSSPVDRYDAVEDDLSSWELVNASQSDDEDLYSYNGDDDVLSETGVVTGEKSESGTVRAEEEEEDEDAPETRDIVMPTDVIMLQSLPVSPPMTLPVEMTRHLEYRDGTTNDEEHDYDRDEDDLYLDDVDDELVPWKLKGRFGKQRIRKMGKRGGSNSKSKKLPHHFNRPGCVFGKHGFGVQYAYV